MVTVAAVIVFMAVIYRMAGPRPAALERRRLAVSVAMITVVAIILGTLLALKAPRVELYGIGLAVAGYVTARVLQKRGHWLVTPTPEEQAAIPARREAIAAITRRPSFWLLVAGLLLVVAILNIAAALLSR